jgi:hypothetical protein
MAKILGDIAPTVTHNPLLRLAAQHGGIVVGHRDQGSGNQLSQQRSGTAWAISNCPRLEG